MLPWTIRVHNPNGISIGSAVFAQLMAASPSTLQWVAPSFSELPLYMWRSGLPSNTWFLGPSESMAQIASWLIQPFLQAHDCDRQTVWQIDHATPSVIVDCIYIYIVLLCCLKTNCKLSFFDWYVLFVTLYLTYAAPSCPFLYLTYAAPSCPFYLPFSTWTWVGCFHVGFLSPYVAK